MIELLFENGFDDVQALNMIDVETLS